MATVGGTPKPTKKKRVFVISPIGAADSPVRLNADRFLNYIVKPALPDSDFEVSRADEDDSPYAITEAMLRAILEADVCVADITGLNANVMYELALAHAAAKKVVIMTSSDESMPFDIKDMRAIRYGLMPEQVHDAVMQLRQKADHEHGSSAFREMLNPVASAFATWMDFKRIEAENGTPDQALGRVVERLESKLDRALKKDEQYLDRHSHVQSSSSRVAAFEPQFVQHRAAFLMDTLVDMIGDGHHGRTGMMFLIDRGKQLIREAQLGASGADESLLLWVTDIERRIQAGDSTSAWALG